MKHMFTPGPANLYHKGIENIHEAFGRGDPEYQDTEAKVLNMIKDICQQETVVPLQGSATLALEIAAQNFLSGNVLIVDTGYYSRRLQFIAERCSKISNLTVSDIENIPDQKYDWIVGCPVETALGYLTPINFFKQISHQAKLFIDATGSIGLEPDHGLADVMAFSSCKGLFGIVGAAFIAYSGINPHGHDSYYLDLNMHKRRGVTGPYHAIQALLPVLTDHDYILKSVQVNKKTALKRFKNNLVFSVSEQPLLSTALTCEVQAVSSDVVLYEPRDMGNAKSVICHFGEIHLAELAQAKTLSMLKVVSE